MTVTEKKDDYKKKMEDLISREAALILIANRIHEHIHTQMGAIVGAESPEDLGLRVAFDIIKQMPSVFVTYDNNIPMDWWKNGGN